MRYYNVCHGNRCRNILAETPGKAKSEYLQDCISDEKYIDLRVTGEYKVNDAISVRGEKDE